MDNVEQDLSFDWVNAMFWTLGVIFSLIIILVIVVIYVVKTAKKRAIRLQEMQYKINQKNEPKKLY